MSQDNAALPMSRYTLFPGIPDGFHGGKFRRQKDIFPKMEESIGGKQESYMMDWKLRATSRHGLTVCVSMVLLKTIIRLCGAIPKMETLQSLRKCGLHVGYSKKSKTSEIGGRPSIDYEITVDMAKQICMRDWRLELNSQSGFQGCVSTVFSIKWTILEVIVKNDKNSKGGRQQQIYMIYFGSDEMTSVLTPPEVQNNGGVQIRELQDYIVSVDTAKHICLISRTEKGKQWSDH